MPQLAKMPTEYVYEPWKAPLEVQKEAGCVIGVDYPAPIVDHQEEQGYLGGDTGHVDKEMQHGATQTYKTFKRG